MSDSRIKLYFSIIIRYPESLKGIFQRVLIWKNKLVYTIGRRLLTMLLIRIFPKGFSSYFYNL